MLTSVLHRILLYRHLLTLESPTGTIKRERKVGNKKYSKTATKHREETLPYKASTMLENLIKTDS